jgi:hypothetical protein
VHALHVACFVSETEDPLEGILPSFSTLTEVVGTVPATDVLSVNGITLMPEIATL